MATAARSPSTGTRGQTTIDFAVGAGLFLVTAAFVVSFVPGMFAPFGGTTHVGMADRAATELATDALGDPTEPYVLNATCTAAFFEQLSGGTNAPTTCRFDTTADSPAALFGATATTDVNVTIERLDGGVASPYGSPLAAGPTPVETGSVTTARRVVLLSGETYRLVVRMW